MPAALIPIITAVIGAAGVGTSIYGMTQQGGDTPKPAPAAPAGPTKDQAAAAIAPQALSIESATGGSVSPDYLSTIAPVLAGVAGQPNTNNAMQQILQQIFGKGGGTTPTPPTSPGATPGFSPSGLPVNLSALAATPGVSDWLAKVAGSSS